MPLTYTVQTAATIDPVDVEDFKVHARVDGTEYDEDIARIISAATQLLQERTRRQFINATFDWYLDRLPTSDSIGLRPPISPLVSVTSITYTDTDGASQTWASTNYTVDAYSEPGRIAVAYDKTYPDHREDTNSVRVRFVAGYGSTVASVPERIRQAVLLVASDLFEHREQHNLTALRFEPSPVAMALISGFVVPEVY